MIGLVGWIHSLEVDHSQLINSIANKICLIGDRVFHRRAVQYLSGAISDRSKIISKLELELQVFSDDAEMEDT